MTTVSLIFFLPVLYLKSENTEKKWKLKIVELIFSLVLFWFYCPCYISSFHCFGADWDTWRNTGWICSFYSWLSVNKASCLLAFPTIYICVTFRVKCLSSCWIGMHFGTDVHIYHIRNSINLMSSDFLWCHYIRHNFKFCR